MDLEVACIILSTWEYRRNLFVKSSVRKIYYSREWAADTPRPTSSAAEATLRRPELPSAVDQVYGEMRRDVYRTRLIESAVSVQLFLTEPRLCGARQRCKQGGRGGRDGGQGDAIGESSMRRDDPVLDISMEFYLFSGRLVWRRRSSLFFGRGRSRTKAEWELTF